MIVKALRQGLGRLIILADTLTRPKAIERSASAQAEVDAAASKLSLYQFYACPFCTKTRRAIRRLALPIELRDAQNDAQHRADLEQQGGRIKVPCLRIDSESGSEWLYESNDIIAYLEQRFGATSTASRL